MICRKREGFLDIRSVSGGVAYEVDLQGESTVLSAMLDDAGERLAIVFRRVEQTEEWTTRESLVVICLATGERRVLWDRFAMGPVWLPGQDRLAFSNDEAICVAEVSSGRVAEVYRFSEEARGGLELCVRPDGHGLAFLQWVPQGRRVGVVDLDTRQGRVYNVCCLSHCWWDAATVLFVLGPRFELLDIHSGKSRPFLANLAELDKPGVVEVVGKRWVQAIRAKDVVTDLTEVACLGDRVYFGARAEFAVAGRAVLPFIGGTRYHGVEGLLSVARDRTDLRRHLDEQIVPSGIVPINEGRTLAVIVRRRHGRKGWREEWAFVGEGAHDIPRGFAPLPRASFALRGGVYVAGYPGQE